MKKETQKTSRNYEGLWMHKYVSLNTLLNPAEKMLLSDVIALYEHTEEGCFKSNPAFGVLLSTSTRTVQRTIQSLQKKGYLRESKQVYDSPIHTKTRYLIPNIGFAIKEFEKLQKLGDKSSTKEKAGRQIWSTKATNMTHIEYKENTAKGSLASKGESDTLLTVIEKKEIKKTNNKRLTKEQIIEMKKDLNTNYIIIDKIMYSFTSIKGMKKETINHLKQRNPNFIKWATNLFEIEIKKQSALIQSLHDNVMGVDSYSVKLEQTESTNKEIEELEAQKRQFQLESVMEHESPF